MSIILGTHTFKAIENIAANDLVYIEPSEIATWNENESGNAAMQAVWVDSDAAHKMATRTFGGFNNSQQLNLTLTASAGNNTNDYVDKTITSKSLSGYTIHFIARASATSGDWEFVLSSGSNAVTNNVKKALTFTSANKVEHISFTVASMTADNGSFDNTGVVHMGFRCVDDTGGPTMDVGRVWYEKSGVTYYGLRKVASGAGGSAAQATYANNPIGIAPAAITAGTFGRINLFSPLQGGFSNLIVGYFYVSSTTAGLITPFYYVNSEGLSNTGTGYYTSVGIAVSDTEILLIPNNSIYR